MVINIGPEQTLLVTGAAQARGVTLELALGAKLTAERFFHHEPPSPYELESAIDAIEEELMRVQQNVHRGGALAAEGAALQGFGEAAGAVMANGVVTLEVVEHLFQRLASESLGNPVARQGLPAGNTLVATALILRECMHHLGFAAITFTARGRLR